MILPGSRIGVLGSGQLGRMLALAARPLGYRVHTLSPEADSPAGQVCEREVVAEYDDLRAVADFARAVDLVTFEFENVPAATAAAAAEWAPVRPSGQVLHIAQNRLREKDFLAAAGLPVTPYAAVRSLADLRAGLERVGCPAVLKTAAFGYDGKGQLRLDAAEAAEAAWHDIGEQPSILEAFVPFEREVSLVAARGLDGDTAHFGLLENEHRQHILDVTVAPARVPAAVAARAAELAQRVLERLDVVGVLCVEFFLTADQQLLINELAPRPHNSGHFTLDACVTSQFEQQLRAVCGLPLGATDQLRPAAMANLLGDLWLARGCEPDWPAALAVPGVKLHLYGKHVPRPGRKMGHLTALAGTVEEARERVLTARKALSEPHNGGRTTNDEGPASFSVRRPASSP